MKKIIAVLTIVLMSVILFGCGSGNLSIVGTWERVSEDSFKGMQVQIYKLDNDTYRATILKSDENENFKVGNLKWTNISSVKSNTHYDIKDIAANNSLYDMQMEFDLENDELTLRNFIDNGEEGSNQKWVRVSKSY